MNTGPQQYCLIDEYRAEKDLIGEIIKNNHVFIFSKVWCPFCKKLKALFEANGIVYGCLELDNHPNGRNIQDALSDLTCQDTVPYTFIAKSFRGGCSNVTEAWATGVLEDWLQGRDVDYPFDLIVIGGGSSGIAAAKEAAGYGKNVAICDWVASTPLGRTWGIGGTCVNVGCIPKKLMHRACLIAHDLIDAPYFGWEVEKPQNHQWESMVSNIQEHIQSIAWNHRKELREKGITYYNGFAMFLDKHTVKVRDASGNETRLQSKTFLLATGGRPRYLDATGAIDLCITSDDIFSLSANPGKTLIIGAGYIALECATFLKTFGCEVKVLVRSHLLSTMDKEMAEKLGAHMVAQGIEFIYDTRVTTFQRHPEGIEVIGTGKDGIIFSKVFDTVLLAIGREPNVKNMGLEELGIKLDPVSQKIVVNERDQTSVPNIFAVGDVRHGAPELTSIAVKSGQFLAQRLFKLAEMTIDYKYIPTTVFTSLEYAFVGESEEHATKIHGDAVEVYHNLYQPIESALSNRFDSRSYVKLICIKICEEGEKVIGLHILGPNAGEIIQGYALAIKLGVNKNQLDTIVGVHPTSAEIIHNLNITKRSGKAIGNKGC